MPPLYFLALAVDFRVFGIGIVPMRALSLVAGVGVLLLTYAVCRRSGLGRGVSAFGVSILALDRVFFRGSLVGRMDMPALALILITVLLALRLAGRPEIGRWDSTADGGADERAGTRAGERAGARGRAPAFGILAGAAGACAFLLHPFGWVAPASLVLALAWVPGRRRFRRLAWVILGLAVVGGGWAIYILADWNAFLVQFGSQVARKAGTEASIPERAWFHAWQYGRAAPFACALWILGLIGLAESAWRERRWIVLPVAQLLIFVTALLSREMWYTLYAAPLTVAGALHLLSRNRRSAVLRTALIVATGALALPFAGINTAFLVRAYQRLEVERRDGTEYGAWAAKVGGMLPPGSTVLLAVIPDPYLGLADRTNVRFREFPPFPIPPAAYQSLLASVDFIVLGRESITPPIEVYAVEYGRRIGEVGNAVGTGYLARVYDMRDLSRGASSPRPRRSSGR
jgi:4-amino-4-deoxy-L-arabinose transferase-like glycosyltransferase